MAIENLIFGLSKNLYNDFVQIFKNYPSIKQILIFGSRAKGTEKPYSDFDLAIIGPDMSDPDFTKLWNELSDLPIVFKLDVVHWDRLTNLQLKEKILKEGKCFYPLFELPLL